MVNYGRAEVVDQPALVEALERETIGGAVLDVTTPEPLPAGPPAVVAATTRMSPCTCRIPPQDKPCPARRERFLDNLRAFPHRATLEAQVRSGAGILIFRWLLVAGH